MDKKPSDKKKKQTEKNGLVLTPGGWRPKSKVHALKPGQHIDLEGGRLKIVDTATGNIVKDLGNVESERPIKHRSGTGTQDKKENTG